MQEPSKKKQVAFVSLGVKMLITFTLLFGVIFGGVYYWFYSYASDAAMNRLKDDLNTLLIGVSSQIDGDEFAALNAEGEPRDDGYTDDERYWNEARFLYQMRQIDPRARFYTYTAGDEANEVRYIGSSGALLDPPAGVQFKQDYAFAPSDAEVILAGLDKTTFYLTIYDDEFGSWISGYTPIKNSAGDSVGALGIDIRAEYVLEVQKDVRDAMIPAAGGTSLLLVIMVYIFSKILTRPVTALTRIAERIGEGDYEQNLSSLGGSRFSDEINTLAQVFEIMVSKVYQREQKLKQQVSELQIMIDESKRQKQVEEIVDTDFFRELQDKARVMRAEFSQRGS